MRCLMISLTVAPLAACGSGSQAAPDADEALACLATGRGETYVAGLEHPGTSGMLDFKLISANPAPPGFNDNTWILQVSAMTGGSVGAPATDAQLTVTPFMPDHQHGSLKVKVEAMPTAGQYKLTPINMWMPGYWEITIDAQVGAVHDTALYKFCIQA